MSLSITTKCNKLYKKYNVALPAQFQAHLDGWTVEDTSEDKYDIITEDDYINEVYKKSFIDTYLEMTKKMENHLSQYGETFNSVNTLLHLLTPQAILLLKEMTSQRLVSSGHPPIESTNKILLYLATKWLRSYFRVPKTIAFENMNRITAVQGINLMKQGRFTSIEHCLAAIDKEEFIPE